MGDAVDTSSEAVEQLKAWVYLGARAAGYEDAQATERAERVSALAAEREALQDHLDSAAVEAGNLLARAERAEADLRRATEAARAADERCSRYDELVERLQRENDALRKAKGT